MRTNVNKNGNVGENICKNVHENDVVDKIDEKKENRR